MFSAGQLIRPETGWPGWGHVPPQPRGLAATERRPVQTRHVTSGKPGSPCLVFSKCLNMPAAVSEKEFSVLPVPSPSTHRARCNPAWEAHRKGFSLLPCPARHIKSPPVVLGTSPTTCLEAETPESPLSGLTGEISNQAAQAGEASYPAVSQLLRVLTESEGNGCANPRQLREQMCRNGMRPCL